MENRENYTSQYVLKLLTTSALRDYM